MQKAASSISFNQVCLKTLEGGSSFSRDCPQIHRSSGPRLPLSVALLALAGGGTAGRLGGMFNPIRIAALFGASGVVLGAFGAHGLKAVLAANQTLEVWHTASLYHLLHAVVLLWAAARSLAFRLFACGILVFSGSLYLLAVTGLKWLGAITPLGGLLLIAGWLALLRKEA
jgi:uncharacterized membrane protein YgdD (TMEM256/DUF423 family)